MRTLGNLDAGWSLADARFIGQMDRALAKSADSPLLNQLQSALQSADPRALSDGERRVLLKLTREMARDGDVSPQEAGALLLLLDDYGEGGSTGALWPFGDIDPARAPGNPLFNAMMAYVADTLGETMNDLMFMSVVRKLLDDVTGNAWSNALWGAFNHVDLAQLSSGERRELLAMLSVATADGDVNWAEAQVILDRLDAYAAEGLPTPPKAEVPDWTVDKPGNGTATIDLGNYTLELNERNSEIWITNKETGERSRIWGDPHFDTDGDGDTDLDFWGTISLNLEDGTRITINTTPWNGNPEMTLSSQLVITNGDQAIVVDGLDQNVVGDLDIRQSDNGRMLDGIYGDGLEVYENPDGEGWLVMDGLWMRPVTQDDMNLTRNMPGTQIDLPYALYAMSGLIASSALLGQVTAAFATMAGLQAAADMLRGDAR